MATTQHKSPIGQLICRRPDKETLSQRTPIVLTNRDKDILVAVFMQGFLTTELIELAFFPQPSDGRHSPSSRAYERVRQLWSWGFVERIEVPVLRSLGGRRPYLYSLGPKGVPVVAEQIQQSVGLVQRRRVDRLRATFLDHELTIATFWAQLIALLRTAQASLQRWIPEREIRARKIRVYDHQAQRWLPVLPDAVFVIHYPGGRVQICYLEVDLGTLTLRRFHQKLRAFEIEEGRWLRRDRKAVEFEVVVFTRSRQRLNQLWRATRDVVGPDRWPWYLFATVDSLDPAHFDEAHWLTAENEFESLLYDAAYPKQSTKGNGTP